MLLEFVNTHGLIELIVENAVVTHDKVALLTDLDHGPDHLILDEQRIEAKV